MSLKRRAFDFPSIEVQSQEGEKLVSPTFAGPLEPHFPPTLSKKLSPGRPRNLCCPQPDLKLWARSPWPPAQNKCREPTQLVTKYNAFWISFFLAPFLQTQSRVLTGGGGPSLNITPSRKTCSRFFSCHQNMAE